MFWSSAVYFPMRRKCIRIPINHSNTPTNDGFIYMYQHTTVFYLPCHLFHFVCVTVFQQSISNPEVNTRGK